MCYGMTKFSSKSDNWTRLSQGSSAIPTLNIHKIKPPKLGKNICHRADNSLNNWVVPLEYSSSCFYAISRQEMWRLLDFWPRRCQIHVTTHYIHGAYSISQEICTRFLLCCALLWLYIDWFSHIHQAYFTGTVAIWRLPQCQQSNPDECG